MRIAGVCNIFGKLLIALSLCLLLPVPFSLYFADGMERIFLLCAAGGAVVGGLFVALFPPDDNLGFRDGYAVVTLSWCGLALLGALPFYFCGQGLSLIDSWFESMSGFTTTGSTILTQIEALPPSVLFWRATTQWLGGMGIIVLTLAILPLLGYSGTQLFQAEMPGPTKDRLAPRIQDTARLLWSVYLLLTAVETGLLMAGGLDLYDALCHAFATMATGGFSPHSASIAYFDSAYIDGVVTLFMFLAGVNFTLHHQAIVRRRPAAYLKSEEFRLYLGLIVLACAVIVAANQVYGSYSAGALGRNIRDSLFQVVSIMPTTGFGTADFDQWAPVCRVLLVILMFVGGCAGSTGGGIKVVRILLFFKYARLQLQNLVHPLSIGTIKVDGIRVPREVKVAIIGFLALYLAVFVTACLLVAATGADVLTATTAVVATLNNIGPGLALVGPTQHFGHLHPFAKLVLSLCMLAGRLELYTVFVLLTPAYWRMSRPPRWRWQKRIGPQGHRR